MKKHYALILLALLPLLMFAKLPSTGIRVFPSGNSNNSRNTTYPLLTVFGREKDPVMDWKDIEKYQYFYNEEGSFYPDRIVEYNMDYSIVDWLAHAAHAISYNSDMQVVEILSGLPTAAGIDPDSRFDIGYDDDGNLEYAYLYARNGAGEFEPTFLFDFVLNPDGFSGTYITMFFGTMTIYARMEIGYDDQGRMVSETTSMSMDQENWELQEKSVHTYHADDTTTFQDLLDYFNRYWALNFIVGFSDIPGMRSLRMDYNYSDGEWIPNRKYEYAFADGKQIEETEYDYEDGAWIAQSKKFNYYNEFDDIATQLNQYPDLSGGFYDQYKYDFVYDIPFSNEDAVQSPTPVIAISTWPMPFKDAINIRIDSKELSEYNLEIFNLKGQLVNKLQTQGKNDALWDGKDLRGKDLPAGIYFLRAGSDQAFSTQKIIKLR